MSYPVPRQPWWVVARREMMVRLTDKSFWISTILVIVIIAGSFGASFFFASAQDSVTVGITDDEGAQVVAIASQSSGQPIRTETMPAAEFEDAIEEGRIDAGLSRTPDGWDLVVEGIETSTGALQQAVATHMTTVNAEALGVDPAQLQEGSRVEVRLAGEQLEQDAAVALITGLVFSILFYMSAMTYGLQIAQSVAEEKESRIVEILSTAIPARQLLVGKAVGNTMLALGQLLVFIVIGVVGLAFTEFSQFLPLLAPGIGWFVVFFLVGFGALSTLWAAAGAMATRVQDVSNTTTPLLMLLMVAFFGGFFARGDIAVVLSYVPVVSSIVMPQRLLSGEASWIDASISLALCLAFMVVAIRFGAMIYRRGLLKTSGMLKLKEVLARD